jgi:hypothetical protein
MTRADTLRTLAWRRLAGPCPVVFSLAVARYLVEGQGGWFPLPIGTVFVTPEIAYGP